MARLCLSLVVLTLLSVPAPARAELTAYEGFDYPLNSDLYGQDGGTGFSIPWARDLSWRGGAATFSAGSLTAGGVQGSGNQLDLLSVSFVPTTFTRLLTTPADAGDTAWVSFTMRGAASGNAGGVLLGRLLIGDLTNKDFFGIQNVTNGLSVSGPSALSKVRSSGEALLVARIQFMSGADTVDLFVNPELGGPVPSKADATLRFDVGSNVSDISVMAWGHASGAAGYTLDELRVGTAFADVTPVGTPPVATPKLSAFQLVPGKLMGGQPATGTVTLTIPAPEGGTIVEITSNSPRVVLPESVVVPEGETSVSFTVNTLAVAKLKTAKVTASVGGVSRAVTLRLNKGRR